MTESDDGAAPRQLTLFAVESIATAPPLPPSYDFYWDEISDRDRERWNPAHFTEAPRIVDDGGQVSLFYDHSDEPPDPDDYENLDAYEQAWNQWESAHVLEQDTDSSQLISSHSHKIGGDRRMIVLERDTTNPVPEQKTPPDEAYTDVPEHILAVPEHVHWLETYCPSNRKDNHYYRYCWKTGTKIKHRHISGGNVRSRLAKFRKQQVEIAIASGRSPSEIDLLIHSWRDLRVRSYE
ncbi:MAG: hypothetical protein V7K40_31735 [Nostoc sp.]|uniref:hypothetical protein n=1 Tax=Nostoc sp. TaxID=1180 RepID=UPI002FF7C091